MPLKKFTNEYIQHVSDLTRGVMQKCLTDLPKFDEHSLKFAKVDAEPDYPRGERFVFRVPLDNYQIMDHKHENLVKNECVKSHLVEGVRRDGEVFEVNLENIEASDVRSANSKIHKLQVTVSLE